MSEILASLVNKLNGKVITDNKEVAIAEQY